MSPRGTTTSLLRRREHEVPTPQVEGHHIWNDRDDLCPVRVDTHKPNQKEKHPQIGAVRQGKYGEKPAERSPAKSIKTDNGSEFISKAMDKWAYERRVELDFSRLGRPTNNARVESFNGRLRQVCLNANWFLSLDDAKDKIEAWRRYYNESHPTPR